MPATCRQQRQQPRVELGVRRTIRPLRRRRHRHQDRIGPSAGLQAEQRAAIEQQVELRVSAAAIELVAALALTTDTSLLTAAANDLGFEHVFARQVEALARPGDLLVIHSTSGGFENEAILNQTGYDVAHARGQYTLVNMTGKDVTQLSTRYRLLLSGRYTF